MSRLTRMVSIIVCSILLSSASFAEDGNTYVWFQLLGAGWGVGRSLARIGDVDGDGVADLAIGAPLTGDYGCYPSPGDGEVFLYSGVTRNWIGTLVGWCGDQLGAPLANVGDV